MMNQAQKTFSVRKETKQPISQMGQLPTATSPQADNIRYAPSEELASEA
jgi:hypothetical protein